MEIDDLASNLEQVSDVYARRFGIDRTDDWLVLKLHEEMGELTQAYLKVSGQARLKGRAVEEIEANFRAEIADVFAHVVLLAHRYDVDLTEELKGKWLHANDDWDGQTVEGLG